MNRWTARWIAVAIAMLMPAAAEAQEPPELLVGAGVGGTYYCIVTRCNTGTIARASVGYSPIPSVMIEGGARWHHCFDCDRFVIGEGGVQVRYPASTVSPFLSAGGSLSSDPEFMGDEWGLYAAVGSWVWLSRSWGLQLELKGRQVGSDHMGELSLLAARRVGR